MALVVNDRVKETSTTTGTGTFTLDGAVTGFETFSSAIGNTNTTYYAIELPNTAEFEVGRGTVSAGQLARTEVISSSNSDNPVNFSAGTKNVFCTLPASKAVIEDASNNVTLPADLTVNTDSLYVDSANEKVNIGTTLGAYTGLNLYKKSGPGNVYFHINGGPGTKIGTSMLHEGTTGDFIINTRDNADIRIYTNNTLRSEFKNNGNFYVDTDTLYVDAVNDRVGIGTTNPTRKLTIAGGNDAKIQFTDGNVQSLYFGDGGSDFAGYLHYDHNNDQFRINTSSNTVLTGGNVGIGTTSPSTLLHLSSSDPQITITDTDGTGSQVIKAVGDDLEIISENHLKLDADTGLFVFRDTGSHVFSIHNQSNAINFKSEISDTDLIFKGNDGGSEITALTLDMSEAGAATFNDKVTLGANKVIEFGDAGETISGDGTKLTVNSSGRLDLLGTSVFLNGSGTTSLLISSQGVQYADFSKENTNNLVIKSSRSDGDFIIRGNDGGANVDALTFDMSEAGDATFNSNIFLGDNKKANFGAGNDLQIYHTGGSSYISDEGTGHLNLRTNGSDIRMIKTDGTIMLQAVPDNRVDLYYNGSKKFETTSTGIQTTGTLNVNGAYTLPTTDGTANQILETDGSGTLTFVDKPAAGVSAGFAVAMAIAL